MDRILSGVGDGCDSCLASRLDWHNLESIEAGFPMDRSFQSVQAIWDHSDKNKHGELMKRRGDYEQRQGVCREPLSVRDTLSFSITHKVFN